MFSCFKVCATPFTVKSPSQQGQSFLTKCTGLRHFVLVGEDLKQSMKKLALMEIEPVNSQEKKNATKKILLGKERDNSRFNPAFQKDNTDSIKTFSQSLKINEGESPSILAF